MTIDGLPVVRYCPRVLSNKVGFYLFNRLSTGEGTAFRDGFAQSCDTGVGVNLEKEPARLHQERFHLGNLNDFLDGRAFLRGRDAFRCQQSSWQMAVSGIARKHASGT